MQCLVSRFDVSLCVCNVGVHRRSGHVLSDVVHVATTSPVCLYSMDTRSQHLTSIDLHGVFPGSTTRYQSYRPRLCLAPLGFPQDSNIIIHDELVSMHCVIAKYIYRQLEFKSL